MQFFQEASTVEEVKTLYKKLAFKYHPDLNPDQREACTKLMQELNAAYEEALKRCDKQVTKGKDGEDHTYNYKEDREKEIVDAIDQLIRIFASSPVTQALGYNPMHKVIGQYEDGALKTEVEIYLVGFWIWIKGHNEVTKQYSKLLGSKEGMGCRWSSDKQMWYWRQEEYRSRRSGKDFSGIAATYGCDRILDDEGKKPGKPNRKQVSKGKSQLGRTA